MKGPIVAPSLLAADPLRFAEDLQDVERSGADWHHVDVMDGHFVPNLSYGLPLVKALKSFCTIPLDVHIMVSNPDTVALDYVDAGADILTFHLEASTHPHRLLQAIRGAGAQASVALNPGTPVEAVFPLLWETDMVLLMSVNPGFGGQSFIGETTARVAQLAKELQRIDRRAQVKIEVDGGINDVTGAHVARAGADALVAGTYVYGAKDRRQPISALKGVNAPAQLGRGNGHGNSGDDVDVDDEAGAAP